MYDFSKKRWRVIAKPPVATSAAAIPLGNDFLFLGSLPEMTRLFNPVTNTWSEFPPNPTSGATVVVDDKLVTVGREPFPTTSLTRAFVYKWK